MSDDQIGAVLERVRSWPAERQRKAMRLLLELEQQDSSPYHLTDEQLSLVRRRRANRSARYTSLGEVREHFERSDDEGDL